MKRKCFKFFTAAALSLALLSSLAGCKSDNQQTQPLVTEKFTSSAEQMQTDAADKTDPDKISIDTRIILKDEKTTINGEGASFKDSILTITKGGTYSIEGKLSDGHILVLSTDEENKVKLYLNSVDIYCSYTAPIFIEASSKETQIILAKNSTNTLSDNASRQIDDSSADSVIYSKDDLQIESEELSQNDKEGTLNINAKLKKGIFSKDDIQIKGGQINITSADDGIRAKDFLEISGGSLTIDAGGDGLRTNNEESEKGNIQISGGTVSVGSKLDGIQATGDLLISGGSVSVCTDGGSTEFNASKPEQFYGSSAIDTQSAESKKALKADGDIEINGGKLTLDSLDDGIHSDVEVSISGATIGLSTNAKAINSGDEVEISGGILNISRSYEGIEAEKIYLSGGETVIKSQDDALNAASNSSTTDTSATGTPEATPMGGSAPRATPHNIPKIPGKEYDGDCIIEISGGKHVLYSDGDGIDSNGDVKMSGGSIVVFGSENGGNSALDFDGEFEMTGGTLLATGRAGMAQAPTQGTYVSFTANVSANKIAAITDKSGKEIISFVSTKPYQSVVFASPSLESGGQYSLLTDVNHSGSAVNGIYSDGSFSKGSATLANSAKAS